MAVLVPLSSQRGKDDDRAIGFACDLDGDVRLIRRVFDADSKLAERVDRAEKVVDLAWREYEVSQTVGAGQLQCRQVSEHCSDSGFHLVDALFGCFQCPHEVLERVVCAIALRLVDGLKDEYALF
jgi:hypothetical protein